jgi:hypothetical protein
LQSLTTQSTAPQNALPSAWVDRLFERFAAMYGKHWFDQWSDVPMADVKDAWQTDLAAFTGEQIRRALDHCKTHNTFPPTLPEFAGMCRQFREIPQSRLAISGPKTDMPDHIREQLRAFTKGERKGDSRDWARKILARVEAGDVVPLVAVEGAREALNLPTA